MLLVIIMGMNGIYAVEEGTITIYVRMLKQRYALTFNSEPTVLDVKNRMLDLGGAPVNQQELRTCKLRLMGLQYEVGNHPLEDDAIVSTTLQETQTDSLWLTLKLNRPQRNNNS